MVAGTTRAPASVRKRRQERKEPLTSTAAAAAAAATCDHGGAHQRYSAAKLRTKYELVEFEALPCWLQDNPYIRTGYRAWFSTRLCFASVARAHNESVNIWTHAAASLFFIVLAAHTLSPVASPILARLPVLGAILGDPPLLASETAALSHKMVVGIFLGACVNCFGLSTIYHTMLCSTPRRNAVFAKCDMQGISLVVITSYVGPIYFGFRCFPAAQAFYLSLTFVLAVVLVVAPWINGFNTAAYRWLRTAVYVACGACGVDIFDIQMRLYAMYLVYACGVAIYLSKFPERWAPPGRFDIVGHSHQLWHLLSWLGTYMHLYTTLMIYDLNATRGFSCAAAGFPSDPVASGR